MAQQRRRATNMAVLTVVILAVVVVFAAVAQIVRGGFRPLKPIDLAVIVAMFLIVTIMDLAPTRMELGSFFSLFIL